MNAVHLPNDAVEGDIIFVSEPYVHILSRHQRGQRCDWCFKEKADDARLPSCQGCKLTNYCNVSCQKHAWKLHKYECKCLRCCHPHVPSESVRLMLKLIVRQNLGDHFNKREALPQGRYRKFVELESHVRDIENDAKRMAEFTEMCQTLKQFADIDDLLLPSASELLELFGRLTINTFSICDGENRSVGVGLYLAASALNHSCNPNAVAVFSGTQVYIRAIKRCSTTAQQPEEVTISYIDLLACKSERQAQLHRYYFTCACALCTDDTHDNTLLSCTCIDNTHLCTNSIQKTQQFLGEFDCVTPANASDTLAHCDRLLSGLSAVTDDHNVYRVRVLDICFDCCVMLEQWAKALEYGRNTLPAYEKLLHKHHPNIGVQMLRVAKLQLFLGHSKDAVIGLTRARESLLVTHGQEHPLVMMIEPMLYQARYEADHMSSTQNAITAF